MTVVVVATCFLPPFGNSPAGEPGIVGISDRMLSTEDESYEPDRGKHIALTPSIMGWYAGRPTEATEVLRAVKAKVQHETATVAEVAEWTALRFSEQRLRRARERIVRACGIPDGEPVPPELWKLVCEYSTETELIVAGVDTTGAHVYKIDEYGGWHCNDVYGFVAIGAGEKLATAYMRRIAYAGVETLADAANAVYAAKRTAEASPSVGLKLNLFMLGPKNHLLYDFEFLERLERAYRFVVDAEQDARSKAVSDVAAYLHRNPNGDGGLPFVLRYP